MAQPADPSIREVLLAEIQAHDPNGRLGARAQQSSILEAAARKMGVSHDQDQEQAILTQWGDCSWCVLDCGEAQLSQLPSPSGWR
jgi:hypothetical protein